MIIRNGIEILNLFVDKLIFLNFSFETCKIDDQNKGVLKPEENGTIRTTREKVHLTAAEIYGLHWIVLHLHEAQASKKNVPILMTNHGDVLKVSILLLT